MGTLFIGLSNDPSLGAGHYRRRPEAAASYPISTSVPGLMIEAR